MSYTCLFVNLIGAVQESVGCNDLHWLTDTELVGGGGGPYN